MKVHKSPGAKEGAGGWGSRWRDVTWEEERRASDEAAKQEVRQGVGGER